MKFEKELEDLKLIKEVKENYYNSIKEKNSIINNINLEIKKLTSRINLLVNRQRNCDNNEDKTVYLDIEKKLRLERLELKQKLINIKNEN